MGLESKRVLTKLECGHNQATSNTNGILTLIRIKNDRKLEEI